MATMVLGGTGFLGARVARALVARGEPVVCVDAVPTPKRLGDLTATIPIVRGDITDLGDLLSTIKRFGVRRVANLAYFTAELTERYPHRALQVNVIGTNNVFEAARLWGLERVVYASSLGYYGLQSSYGGQPVEEDSPGFPVTVYGATKWMNDFMAAKYARDEGLSLVGLRMAVVAGFGRESGTTVWADSIVSLPAVGQPVHIPLRSSQPVSIVYVDDCAEAFATLLLAPEVRRLTYLSGGHTLTLGALADLVRREIPDACITFDEQAPELPYVYAANARWLREEFGLTPAPLEERIREHIAEARRAAAR